MPKTPKVDLAKLDDFAKEADYVAAETKKPRKKKEVKKKELKTDTAYPWEASTARGDVDKGYNVPISEPEYLMLKYIAQHTPDSMRKFCREALSKAINAKIKELTKK